MKKYSKYMPVLLSIPLLLGSCKDELSTGVLREGDYGDRTAGLKDAFNIPIGTAVDFTPFTSNAAYLNVAKSDFDMVTFGYHMKHGAIVKDDGSFDFSRTDQMAGLATQNGLEIFGHTLVWHQNQNASYLSSLTAGSSEPEVVNLANNGGFENGLTGWSTYNAQNGATVTAGSGANEVRTGNGSMKIVNPQDNPGGHWRVQIASDPVTTVVGRNYQVTFWVKSATNGGSGRLSTQPSAIYQGDWATTTDWTPVSWTFTANEPQTRILFDMGLKGNTYYIDDFKVFDPEAPAPDPLLVNGGFEDGPANLPEGWAVYNAQNGAAVSVGAGAAEVRTGTRSLKIVNPQDNPGGQWRVQIASSPVKTTVGTAYRVTLWVKSATAGGSGRMSTQPSALYQGDWETTTDWSPITWVFTANEPETRILFDMGLKGNTYFIDDMEVVDNSVAPPSSGGDASEKVDEAMKDFITASVNRYKGVVKAWDVVNEPMVESGALRTNANTTVPSGATDIFFWSQYLGRDYALKAFKYAAEADPEAKLFINEYNLESSPAKLDSLISYVSELKAKGAKIDGIGTQMHVLLSTPRAGIDNMFRKLAATGLLIRVSELDVRVNANSKQGFVLTPQYEGYQAEMYEYIIRSYLKHVPQNQQHGITIWGISDDTSWLYKNGADFPLLYHADFSKKAAYGGVLKAAK